MDEGFEIPIGADLAPFLQAMKEISREIRALGASIQASLAPASQQLARSTTGMAAFSTGARGATASVSGMIGRLSAAGAATANIVAGAQAVRTAWSAIGRLGSGGLAAAMGSLRSRVTQIGTGLRSLMSNPALRRIAIGAAAGAAAVLGIVATVKAVRVGFSVLSSGARATFSSISAGARAAGGAITGLAGKMRSIVPGAGGGGGSMLGPLAGLAGLAAGAAVLTTQLSGAFRAAAAFEDLEVRVSSFLGSVQASTDLLRELSVFADRTPFATRDIQSAAATFLGSGIRGDIAGLTKDLAAVASNGQQLGELSDALGKGFAKGKFQTEELNKFLERGINLMPALQAVTGATREELGKMIEKGLDFETVTSAIRSLSAEGGMFFGLLERRSKTASGLVSTLGSVWETVKRTFAQPIVDSLKHMIADAISMVETFQATAAAAGKKIGDALLSAFALIKSGQTFALLSAGFALAVAGATDLLMRGLRSAVAFLATALPPIFSAAFAKLSDPGFWAGIRVLFSSLGSSIAAEIKSALPFADLDEVASLRTKSKIDGRIGEELIGSAGNTDFTAVFKAAVADAAAAAAAAAGGPASDSLATARDSFNSLMDTVRAQSAAMRSATAVPPPALGATGEATGSRFDAFGLGEAIRQIMPVTTSLGRVGGGSLGAANFAPMITEQRKANGLLQKLVENTARPMAAIA